MFGTNTNTTRLPSNLNPTTRDCVHLVLRGHFRSRDKDGGHTIQTVIAKKHVYANLTSLSFLRTIVMGDRSLHCGNRDFRLFCSYDLDLDSMTFIYELDPYSLEIHRMCKYELPTSMLSRVIV